jgi:hypothetical protein
MVFLNIKVKLPPSRPKALMTRYNRFEVIVGLPHYLTATGKNPGRIRGMEPDAVFQWLTWSIPSSYTAHESLTMDSVASRRKWEKKEVTATLQDGSREWITFLACVCADGSALLPSLVYQAVTGSIHGHGIPGRPRQPLESIIRKTTRHACNTS